jgi:NitT/TauT family transport system substrate-binding protein
MKILKVDADECIGCRACAMVAEKNFEMNDDNIAFVKNQPLNQDEEDECDQALDVCPVMAISVEDAETEQEKNKSKGTSDSETGIKAILAKDTVKATLDAYPQLKPILTTLSPKFKKLQIPAMYNTIARFATFRDAAKLADISVCEVLHALNKELGTENELVKNMPECISSESDGIEITGEEISWEESSERYIYNVDVITELIEKVSNLGSQENFVIISIDKPDALLKTIVGLGLKFNIEKNREFSFHFQPKSNKK